ncbi:MAG: MAPEG family protein [Devosia sp.]
MDVISIALWCILAAWLLAIVAAYPAKLDTKMDNRDPRARHALQKGFRRRAYSAHLNSLEALTPFAAAVIVAHMLGAPQGRLDMLAVAFVVVRVGYVAAYYGGLSVVRSALWGLGAVLTIAIFTLPVWGG